MSNRNAPAPQLAIDGHGERFVPETGETAGDVDIDLANALAGAADDGMVEENRCLVADLAHQA